jgi:hypothetical protein
MEDDLRLVARLRAEAALEQVVGALRVRVGEAEVGAVGGAHGPGNAGDPDERRHPHGEYETAMAEAPGRE